MHYDIMNRKAFWRLSCFSIIEVEHVCDKIPQSLLCTFDLVKPFLEMLLCNLNIAGTARLIACEALSDKSANSRLPGVFSSKTTNLMKMPQKALRRRSNLCRREV